MKIGDTVFVTRVAYKEREKVEEFCTPLVVEHATDKAVLLRAREFQQWFPRSVLQQSSTHRDVYLLRSWFALSPAWRARCGTPPQRAC